MATLDPQYDSSKFLLTAVNVMLSKIGERPINDDVELADVLEAQLASQELINTKKEVLSQGWDFNMDTNYSIPPDNTGYIIIPANVLDLSSSDSDLIMRDWRLYSKSGQTAVFEEPKAVNIIWDLDFNSLTHPIRNYITLLASAKFIESQVMDTDVYKAAVQDAEDARIIARKSEGFTGGYNMLTSGNFGLTNVIS
ncbi:hypothetical protein OAE88_00690 [bacterium]|nr:hypothetical protein [bacterium]